MIPQQPKSLRARWVLRPNEEPIENGVVRISNGVVECVHGQEESVDFDCGNAAIIPALVNAHTHLEFSGLAQPVEPPLPFTDWVRAVVRQRMSAGEVDPVGVIQAGISEAAQTGTCTIGEIATSSAPQKADFPGRAVIFREIIGFAQERVSEQTEIGRTHLSTESDSSPVKFGLSPHAPYSVHPDLLNECVQLAKEFSAPLAMHIAETRDELQFLKDQSGLFRQLLEDFGVWDATAICEPKRPLDYLKQLAQAPRALVVHGNYLDDEELQFIADHSSLTLVFCPRTHHFFQHAPHPWRRAVELGCRIAFGTDSRASNPDLSLFAELQFVAQQCGLEEKQFLLTVGTRNGADALGFTSHEMQPGDAADLAVVRLPDLERHPLDLLFDPQSRVEATVLGGTHRT